MKKIQSHKGITLISLIAYIILTLIVLGILGTITANFRKNISGMNAQSVQDTEFDKLNLQLLRETKNEENKIIESESNLSKIAFSNGNIYTYDSEEQTVYLNDNIKIAENIESCDFAIKKISNKQRLTATVQINGAKRITEYILLREPIEGTRVNANTEYTIDGKTAIIPAGFTVSGIPDEQSIDEGLVIYLIDDKTDTEIENIDWTDSTLQTTYDQFVWIPISHEQINNMYICQAKTADNGTCNITVNAEGKAECQTHKGVDSTKATQMAGRLYATDWGANFEQGYTEAYTAGSGLREPDTVSSYDDNTSNLTTLNTILEKNFAPTTDTTNNKGTANTDFKTYLQEEYNEIVKSVYENQGFYIGRYETSGMANTDTNPTIKVVAGSNNTTNANISAVNWYRMYAQQKKYAENKGLTSVKSTMIQGAAYDQVMKFVENGTRPDREPYTIKTVGNVAHTPSQNITGEYQTGGINYPSTATVPYNDCVKNIYDLEGNVRAWTTEAYSAGLRMYRRR